MVEVQHQHRPSLKQTNKKFKSKHATKSSLKDTAKGRFIQKSLPVSRANVSGQWRLNRRNTARQTQAQKRKTLILETRFFNGADGVPRIVAVIPLSEDVTAISIVSSLSASLDISAEICHPEGLWRLKAHRFRTSLQFVTVPYRNFYFALDACKIADYVVFALSTTVEVDVWGDTLLRTLQAQGFGDVITVAAPNHSLDPKFRPGVLKSLLSFMRYFFPSQTKVYDLHVSSDRLNTLRSLSEGKPTDVRWREGRSWILGEKATWDDGVLAVTGFVRGAPLSVNRLVHLSNFGDFQLEKILSAPLPRYGKSESEKSMEKETLLLESNPDEADSLVSSNDPDDIANEQTWPNDDEIEMDSKYINEGYTLLLDAKAGTTPKYVRHIPKGMNSYQATWIVDEEDDVMFSDTEGNISEEEIEQAAIDTEQMAETSITEDSENDNLKAKFHDLDMKEDERQLIQWRSREREEKEDLSYPDEMDTPKDIFARVRFQRYRGLRSVRTSPWDPFENLPRDYGRIFQFEKFKRTERNVRRRTEKELGAIQPGYRVTLHIKGVPQEATASFPLTLFGLFQHEHKFSVLNFTIQRNTEYKGLVRSKDPLILCIGPRRLRSNPIFSQSSCGGNKGPNNVHKFERFLRHGSTNVATIYGPITYGMQPCTLLRETSNAQAPELVATGSFLNPDTTRIVAKRIILTGHPFRVNRKTATIRYMFFNPEDVNYFKPIQLHTKYGRSGHICESLGTHGYLKAHFDRPITQMDTVCMSLYKRVFPKWSTPWLPMKDSSDSDDAMEY